MEILCSFRLVLDGKTGKETPESSRLELLEKFLANNFALSDVEGYIGYIYISLTKLCRFYFLVHYEVMVQ